MRTTKTLAIAATCVAALGLGFAGVKLMTPTPAHADDAQVASPIKVDDFRLTTADYHSIDLRRMKDASAIVLITQQNGCPVVRNTAASVKALQDEYAGKHVEFMMLNSTPSDSHTDIQAEAKAYGYDLPILMDSNQLVGEQLGVTRTAEAIVIDPKTWKIVYRGPIDDRVTYERQKAKADHTWAKDALDAMLAGKPVADAREEAVGCLIDFPHRNKLAYSKISYVKDVAPIIRDKCVACHEQNGIGPMALTSYDKIKTYSPMIREVLRTQRMPPWRADPTVGHFLDDKSLSGDQIKTLVHWVEAGAPRGTGKDPLAAKKYVASDWPLGKPDVILDVPAYKVQATGIVDYQHPWVKNPLTDGKWLRASTIKVENRQVVHHILTGYMADVPKEGQPAFEDKWGVSVGGYAVGAESEVMPADTGAFVPPGGAIGFQNHYTPFGKEVTEHSKIGLYFYNKKPDLIMHGSVIANPNISIPPNQGSWEQKAYIVFPKDALLYSAFPHAHYRGASSQLWLQTPDGAKKLLVVLPNYDFNWQRDYNFAQPIKIPAGSKLIAIYTYDNSIRNPANPDHNRTVPWGDQSMDEMLYTALRYRWVGETSAAPNNYDEALNGSRLFGMLDQRMDNKITKDELTGPVGSNLLAHFDQIDFKKQGYISPEEWATVQSMMGHHHHASGSAAPEDPNAPRSTASDAKPAPTAAAAPVKPAKVASASTTASH
jgi:peroxiredoxin/mono/diheme cytochrome c family protein